MKVVGNARTQYEELKAGDVFCFDTSKTPYMQTDEDCFISLIDGELVDGDNAIGRVVTLLNEEKKEMLKAFDSNQVTKMRFEELEVGDVYRDESGHICIKISSGDSPMGNCLNTTFNELYMETDGALVIPYPKAELRI